MSPTSEDIMGYPLLRLSSVFHPTDFSQASEVAFAHALKLALGGEGRASLMHIGRAKPQWSQFPKIRETLTRWGLLPPGSPKTAVGRLGLKVEKVQFTGGGPVRPILCYLDRKPADFVVLATHQRRGARGGCTTPLPNPFPDNRES